MYIESYLKTADLILSNYTGKMPFAPWLRDFFKQDKKYGSRDRKIISHLCYSFFRLGRAFQDYSLKNRVCVAQFLTAEKPSLILEAINPEWNEKASLPLTEKLDYLNAANQKPAIFPWLRELSDEIDSDAFTGSHLVQPDLFLRVRPGYEEGVLKQLAKENLEYAQPIPFAIAIDNGTKTDQLFNLDIEVVVQDLSSQQVLNPLIEVMPDKASSFTAWDCCAASGGKAILLHDTYPKAKLTVSDVRQSILHNLAVRFERAGIKSYSSQVMDVSVPDFELREAFDLVLCDAPCSGSGTWGRTPEQLHFFRTQQIDHYSNLQKKIALNASHQVKKGGYFLYITCSVFKKENEEVVEHLQKSTALQLITTQYYKGYHQKADTLFTALFTL
jgi:16S rRNA (cytosine967-C5)-methyltransferase